MCMQICKYKRSVGVYIFLKIACETPFPAHSHMQANVKGFGALDCRSSQAHVSTLVTFFFFFRSSTPDLIYFFFYGSPGPYILLCIKMLNGLVRSRLKRSDYINGAARPYSIINEVHILEPSPACVGHGPARPVYFLL